MQPGETTVSLTSSDPAIVSVPATIPVPGGALSAAIPVAGVAPGPATITATLNGSSLQSTVTVRAGVTLTSLLPTTLAVRQGASGPLMVTLSAVPDTDTVVSLTSSNAAIVAVPPEGAVTIPAGQRSQTVAVAGVNTGTATLTATLNGSTVQTHMMVTIASPTVVRLESAVFAFATNRSGTFTVTLNATQPTDTEVLLATSDEWVISLPNDRMIVPANTQSATFTVAAADGGLATVTATLNGSTRYRRGPCVVVSARRPRSHVCKRHRGRGHGPLDGDPELYPAHGHRGVPHRYGTRRPCDPCVGDDSSQHGVGHLRGHRRGRGERAGEVRSSQRNDKTDHRPGGPRESHAGECPPQPCGTRAGGRDDVDRHPERHAAHRYHHTGDEQCRWHRKPPRDRHDPGRESDGLHAGDRPRYWNNHRDARATQWNPGADQTHGESIVPNVIAVTPAEATVVEWNAVSLTVTLSAAHPEPTVISLTSSDPETVTVPTTVTVPAHALSASFPVLGWVQGTATVTVGPLNGSSVSVRVTVTPWELLSFAIMPPTATIAVGQIQQFMAIAAYNDEILEDNTEVAWWAAGEETVAHFAERGVATTLAPGDTTIYAGMGERFSATPATLTVTPTTLITFTLAPKDPTRAVGESAQFRVTGTLTDGTTEDLTQTVTWTSSNSTVATITSPGGLAMALTPGTTTITAAYRGVPSTSATMTVAILAPTLHGLIPTRGRAGMAVNLFGTNLGATAAVRLNGTAAAFTVQSFTQVTAVVPVGATTGPVTVTTPSGTVTSSVNFTLTAPPTVVITSPADGTTITGSSVQMRGTVTGDTEEARVVVNGLAAQVNGGQWAVTVPLSSGSNALTGIATDATGAQATASTTVTATEAPAVPLVLRAVPDSGVAPFIVRWQVTNLTGRPLVRYELDEHGTGTFNPPVTTLDGVPTTYTIPGLAHPILRATDDQGTPYLATTTINVLPMNQTDAILQAKWSDFRVALQGGAISTAVGYVTPLRRTQYSALFTALADQLPQFAQEMQGIQLIYLVEGRVKYRLRRTELYGGQTITFTYYVYFVQDANGTWSIEGF